MGSRAPVAMKAFFRRQPMTIHLGKYWHDIIVPIIRRDSPPIVPQAVVLHEQQVLLVQRDNPRLWELPGGGVQPGELLEETVVREVEEETGLRVAITELLGWYERTGFRAHRSPVYLCRPLGGELRPQLTETLRVQFFPLHTLPTGMFPWYRSIVQHDLMSCEPHPLTRIQHVSLGVVLHCLALDIGNRLGLLT